MSVFKNLRITVAGLGTHGGAVGNIRWLHEQGAVLTVTDTKPAAELQPALTALADLRDITWVLGEHRFEDFTNTDMVLRNPALRRTNQYLQAARAAGVSIEMDSSLFLKSCPTRHVIGVTGSKGKTTTAHCIASLMGLGFRRTALIGIEGTSVLSALTQLKPEDLVVFELSSWRLEALDEQKISPPTSVITSIYHDHLNTYSSFAEYVTTKKTMIRYQVTDDLALLNFDDETVRSWNDAELRSRVAWYSRGDFIPGDGIYVARNTICCRVGKNVADLFPLASLKAGSEHEQRNILPGIFLAWLQGVRPSDIKLQLNNRAQLPHRLEPVRNLRGVLYVNDSAATIPEAAIAALKAYRDHPIVLIAGGNDKQLTFDQFAFAISRATIRAIIFLPGDATARQQQLIRAARVTPIALLHASTMEEAVTLASDAATTGDVVLLSPGATSFGLFQHEFDRGDQFKAAVNALT